MYGEHNTLLLDYGSVDDLGTCGAISEDYAEMQYVNHLWKIVRVNEDGSVRLVYSGVKEHVYDESTFNPIGKSFYNSLDKIGGNAALGYMYGLERASSDLSGACLTYNSSDNSVVDSTSTYGDESTCSSNGGTWVTSPYEATHANIASSTVKTYLENWYKNNLLSVSGYIADAGFCNDRSVAPTANTGDTALGYGYEYTYYGGYNRLVANSQPQFKCPQTNDLFTTKTSNYGNRALTYPIGLITGDEISFANGAIASSILSMTPSQMVVSDPRVVGVENGFREGEADIYPVININSTVAVYGGTGSSTYPYILK